MSVQDVVCGDCGFEAESARGLSIHRAKSHEDKVRTSCNWCGTSMEVTKSRFERGNGKFCSKECDAQWRSSNLTGEDNPAYNSITVQCDWCEEKFERIETHVRDNTFCSQECFGKWMSENWVGEGHPSFKEDNTRRYWSRSGWREIRKEVLERDSYVCVHCGRGNEENLEEFGKSLSVHHRTPISEFDSPEEADELSNLEAVCQVCHPKVEEV